MLQAILGIGVFCLIPFLFCSHKRSVRWKLVLSCLLLQFGLAFLLLNVASIQVAFLNLNGMVQALQEASMAGSSYMFGYLGGAPLPFDLNGKGSPLVIAFQILPIVLVMSAISAVLFHWGVLQKIIGLLGFLLQKILRLDGLQTFSVASSTFFGIVEAPLLIRPYLKSMTIPTLFLVITAGMSTVAGTVMALYATQLQGVVENPIGHILVASLISLPAAVLMAHLWYPGDPEQDMQRVPSLKSETHSSLQALAQGAEDGMKLFISIIGMLIVLFAMVYLVDEVLVLIFGQEVSLQGLVAYPMRGLAWLMGIPAADLAVAGELLSTKVILNEFVAYQAFAGLGPSAMSAETNLILIYALCGFANLGSLGLVIGAIGTMAPERLEEVVSLAPKAVVCGLLATCMTGAVVGLLH